jgi:hypothetical protein
MKTYCPLSILVFSLKTHRLLNLNAGGRLANMQTFYEPLASDLHGRRDLRIFHKLLRMGRLCDDLSDAVASV